jgi:histidine triad (HIT) family protein
MTQCIFCRIAADQAPSVRLYEDELVIAFLDIAPITPGHTLIIPREHHNSVTTVPEPVLTRMITLAPQLGQALVRITKADGFNLHLANGRAAGQIVLHTHLHVIPRSPADGFSWGWRTGTYASDAEQTELAAAVRERLSRHDAPDA